MKDFITEDGRITNCSYNVAQMTVWEYLTIIIGIRAVIQEYGKAIRDCGITILNGIWAVFALVMNLVLFPVYPIIVAIITIREAKRDVINHSDDRR